MNDISTVTTTPKRDIGLDALRVLALVLMLSVHTFRPFPLTSIWGESLRFFAEAAPAFFFFAFGMTYPMYARKPRSEQTWQDILFFFAACLHSFYLKNGWFTFDFLVLLVAWRILLGVFEHHQRKLTKPLLIGILVFLSILLLLDGLKGGKNSPLGPITPGYFPLATWALFCFLGLFFAELKRDSQRLAFGLILLVSALGIGYLAPSFGHRTETHYKLLRGTLNIFVLIKSPVSLSYTFFFSAISVFLATFLNRKTFFSVPFRAILDRKLVTTISSNLFLFIPIHYLAMKVTDQIAKATVGSMKSKVFKEFCKRHELTAIFSASASTLVISLLLVLLIVAIMKREWVKKIFSVPMRNAVATGFLLLAGTLLTKVFSVKAQTREYLPLFMFFISTLLVLYDKTFRKERNPLHQETPLDIRREE